MKGMVFNSFQVFVEDNYGVKAWDAAINACDLPSEGIYVSTRSYDDFELEALIQFFSKSNSMSSAELLRAFGRYVFADLMNIAPKKAKEATDLRAFLRMVHNIIHVEVKKLYADSNLPHFSYRDEENVLVMIYTSPRKLCFFSEGLILAAAEYFKECITVSQSKCMHKGAKQCQIEVVFHDSTY